MIEKHDRQIDNPTSHRGASGTERIRRPRPERVPALGRLARELRRETMPLVGADCQYASPIAQYPSSGWVAVEQPE